MPYIIYDIKSTVILTPWNDSWKTSYKTESAAKAAQTRILKAELKRDHPRFSIDNDFAIADSEYFKRYIEKTVTKRNLMSGEAFEISVNEHPSVDPSTEKYWSM